MIHTNRPTHARPRAAKDIASLPPHPDVVLSARRRGVEEVVHFTTRTGAIGILATRALKSRKRLRSDEYLEHVYRPNAPYRKDQDWQDYVNLSIARINDWMFDSSERWHAEDDNPWVVLSFDPEILGHPGVVFTTTNNIYPSCRRAEGVSGFDQLFSGAVFGRYNERHDRERSQSDWPTDRQAEVLYPGEVSCCYLRRIYVDLEETADNIVGILTVLQLDVPVHHAPEVFE